MNTNPWTNLQTNGEGPLDQRRRIYRTSTAPTGDYSAHPRALMPGHGPPLIDRSDFYFTNAAQMPIACDIRNAPMMHPFPLYPIQVAANVHPPLPLHSPPPPRPPLSASLTEPHLVVRFQRSLSSPPPPLPPKPLIRIPPTLRELSATDNGSPDSTPPAAPTTTSSSNDSPTEDRDMAMALALSQSVSTEQQRLRDKLSTQEEEDLARALEASLRESDHPMHSSTSFASSSADVQTPDLYVHTRFPDEHGRSDIISDEALARMLATGDDEESRTPVRNTASESHLSEVPVSMGNGPDLSSQPIFSPDNEITTSMASGSAGNIVDDEAFTPRLTQDRKNYDSGLPQIPEYNRLSSTESQSSVLPIHSSRKDGPTQNWQADSAEESHCEAYTPRLSAADAHISLDTPSSPDSRLPYLFSPASETIGHPPAVTQESFHFESNARSPHPASGARPSNAGPSNVLPVENNTVGVTLRPETGLSSSSGNLSLTSSTSSLSNIYGNEADADVTTTSSPNLAVVNQNYFVDQELFFGVSIGFKTPVISMTPVAMTDPMPNIISLPYGRCPPLHIHGPSWRHLLKLMARLSGTRLEPTLDAVAVTKTDLKLRTVIQFIKPHSISTDWRTVFYFTIDYPSPRNSPESVNDLPYSYSLSSIPPLLRHAADTPLSKTYTIPASESVPYPTLPITFPNLAMYLQAALEESRRHLNDSSSGHRKLAKMVQTCYPSEDSIQDAPERHSVGGLFKRVIGRSSKHRRGGNEDTYELVTPFVPDEWG